MNVSRGKSAGSRISYHLNFYICISMDVYNIGLIRFLRERKIELLPDLSKSHLNVVNMIYVLFQK